MELISFVLSYFLTKGLSMMTAFICWTPEQVSELFRSTNRAGVRLALVSDFQRAPPMSPRGWFPQAMLLDLACPGADLILDQASASRGFNYRHSWLLLHNSSSDRSIIEATLSACSILPDADVVWSSPESLVDVYKVKPGMPHMQTVLGLARNCSRQELQALWGALPTAVSRRRDLRNVSMKGISIVTEPVNFKGWSDLRNREIDTFPKFTHPLMLLAAEDLHFRFDLRQVDFYGVSHNGSFDGLVGRLQHQQAEVGLASLFMRSDRMQVADFISETCVLASAFIFRQPSRSAVSNVFLAPFSSGVWAASGGVAAAAALLLVALRTVRERTRPGLELEQFTLPETVTFALGTLCQQGFYSTPAVTSVRVVMFSTLLMALFVFTAYSAKIVAILQTPSDALRSIDDLTRSPMVIGVQETTYKKVYYLESPDESTAQLYRRKILPQGERAYHSVLDGIARVRTGLFAFQVRGEKFRVRHNKADVHGAREMQPQRDRGVQVTPGGRAHEEALRLQGAVRQQDALAAGGGPDGPRAPHVAGGAAAVRGGRRRLRQHRHHRRAASTAGVGARSIDISPAACVRSGGPRHQPEVPAVPRYPPATAREDRKSRHCAPEVTLCTFIEGCTK